MLYRWVLGVSFGAFPIYVRPRSSAINQPYGIDHAILTRLDSLKYLRAGLLADAPSHREDGDVQITEDPRHKSLKPR